MPSRRCGLTRAWNLGEAHQRGSRLIGNGRGSSSATPRAATGDMDKEGARELARGERWLLCACLKIGARRSQATSCITRVVGSSRRWLSALIETQDSQPHRLVLIREDFAVSVEPIERGLLRVQTDMRIVLKHAPRQMARDRRRGQRRVLVAATDERRICGRTLRRPRSITAGLSPLASRDLAGRDVAEKEARRWPVAGFRRAGIKSSPEESNTRPVRHGAACRIQSS